MKKAVNRELSMCTMQCNECNVNFQINANHAVFEEIKKINWRHGEQRLEGGFDAGSYCARACGKSVNLSLSLSK